MTRLACRYAIVQFMPYPETGEFANCGVVVTCPRSGFFGYRLERKKYGRITNFFDELPPRIYLDAVGNFEAELARVSFQLAVSPPPPDIMRGTFDHLTHPREAIIRFGGARAIMTESPQAAVEQLFGHYVGRNFATKEYQETKVAKRVARIVNSLNLHAPFKEERLGNDDYAVSFPLVQHNEEGRPHKAIKPLFLGQDEPNKIYLHGDSWLAKIRRLRSLNALPGRMLFAIHSPDSAFDRRLAAADSIKKELKAMNAEVIEVGDEDRLIAFATA